ncbi:MAG TPA: glycoside hydrolase domain-containing protein [Trebonia sp.]
MAGRSGLERLWRAVTGGAAIGAFLAASAAALPSSSAAAQTGGDRVVSYHGYQVTVPASWPVYNLAADPARCVLFNEHAVYLGTPGADQACPARAYGRTEALLIQPSPKAGTAAGAGTAAAVPKSAVVLPANTAAFPASATLPATAAKSNAVSHELQVEVPGPGVLVTATYGTNQSQVRSILAGATTTAGTTGASAQQASPAATEKTAASPAVAASQGATASRGATAVPKPADSSAAPDLAGVTGSGLGFDACTAPSEATMRAWLGSPYRVMGTYLGGVNWACDYGNFTADWVRQVSAEGWRFIPIWVGEQAPCSGIKGAADINPSQAAAEGTAEAASAVSTAQGFDYGTGTTIYFDMEGFSTSNPACGQAVLTFLSAWTQGLHAAGYESGVYSSAGSGITDLASEYGAASYNGAPYTSPDDVWIADWDGNPVLSDPYLPDSDWANGQRLRQYTGGHNETWGGDTINIDSDIIGGPVAALPGAHVDAGPSLLSGPDAVTAAPGAAARVRLTLEGTSTTPADETWHAVPPAGITVTPALGRVMLPAGHPVPVHFTITPDASLTPGRYEVPVTIAEHGKTIAETFELVSVTASGTSLPTAHPIVLYAADPASMASAQALAAADALPASDVTGTFTQAWTDLTGGKDLVIAVGQAAVNGLFYNPCGWASPSGSTSGGTPFYWLGPPFRQSPGADIYEPADGTTDANSALLAAQLTHFALTGSLPDYGRPPTQVPRPARTCLGSPDEP